MKKQIGSLVVLMLLVGSLVQARTQPAQAQTIYFTRYEQTTGHNLSLPFLKGFDEFGGLPVIGYPISEAFLEMNADEGRYRAVQYFERNRMENHPENAWPYRLLLGRLGDEILKRQGRDWQTFPKADPAAAHYFPETGHAVADVFWGYWSSHGLDFGDRGVSFREALALWGLPLSEPAMETNSSGDTVLTQWFERARFEYHPHNPDPHKVLLGLLGNELTAGRRAETAFQPAPALDIPHAAARRAALADAEQANQPIPYRDDIQALADQAAEDWTREFNNRGDDRAVLHRLNDGLKPYPPYARALYAVKGVPLEAQCQGVDAIDPAARAVAGPEYRNGMKAITLGVTGIYQDSCGLSLSFVLVKTY